MTHYCLGFLFDAPGDVVALIRKVKPEWMAGKWNGVGGKVEPGENANHAMVREFEEETGVSIPPSAWSQITCVVSPRSHISVYAAFDERVWRVQTKTSEPVRIFPVLALPPVAIPNINWLIPMALIHGRFEVGSVDGRPAEVVYR